MRSLLECSRQVWTISTTLNQLVVPERVQTVGDGRDMNVFALLVPSVGGTQPFDHIAALVFCESFHPILSATN